MHTSSCVYSTDNTQAVDEDHYSHPQPGIEYLTPYEAISLSSPIIPTNTVDDAGYLHPQPSIQYAESHQAVSTPTTVSYR